MCFFFFKQKTSYEMRISDWSSDVCSSDLFRKLSTIRVEGDSMVPTLADGDEILVDRSDAGERVRDGIYVLRMDEALIVKRLSVNPAARSVSIRKIGRASCRDRACQYV